MKVRLKSGTIQPLEPFPPEWKEGQELRVEAIVDLDSDTDPEASYQRLCATDAEFDPEDWAGVEAAMAIADQEAKALVRKSMGLP